MSLKFTAIRLRRKHRQDAAASRSVQSRPAASITPLQSPLVGLTKF